MIVQLNPEVLVETPLGCGIALLVIDYGIGHNTCWVVALSESGQIKHFDSNDVKLARNHTYKINLGENCKTSKF